MVCCRAAAQEEKDESCSPQVEAAEETRCHILQRDLQDRRNAQLRLSVHASAIDTVHVRARGIVVSFSPGEKKQQRLSESRASYSCSRVRDRPFYLSQRREYRPRVVELGLDDSTWKNSPSGSSKHVEIGQNSRVQIWISRHPRMPLGCGH